MKNLILTICFLASGIAASAQTDTTQNKASKLYLIRTHDGAELIGKIISQDARELLIETKDKGQVAIPKYLIKEMKEVDAEMNAKGDFVPSEIFSTRYFIGTNGLPIKKGESYLQWNYWGPDFELGVGKNFSVGVMSTWLLYPVVGTAKYSIPLGKKTNLAIGAIAGTSTWYPESSYFGFALPFGSITYGGSKNNISFSGGYGSTWNDRGTHGNALFSVGAMAKMGKKVSFVFDSFFLPQSSSNRGAALVIPGIRLQTKSDMAFQVGLAMVAADDGYIPFPIPLLQLFKKI